MPPDGKAGYESTLTAQELLSDLRNEMLREVLLEKLRRQQLQQQVLPNAMPQCKVTYHDMMHMMTHVPEITRKLDGAPIPLSSLRPDQDMRDWTALTILQTHYMQAVSILQSAQVVSPRCCSDMWDHVHHLVMSRYDH